jgi:hypothetical protein
MANKFIEMTKEECDRITKALDKDCPDVAAIEQVVRDQIDRCGDCSAVLGNMLTAIMSGSDNFKERAANRLKWIWPGISFVRNMEGKFWLEYTGDTDEKRKF